MLALDELPGDLDDIESRLVAFLALADGEPQNWQTLLEQRYKRNGQRRRRRAHYLMTLTTQEHS